MFPAMPNQRDATKKCFAGWIDGELLAEWKAHCDQMGKNQTDRFLDLVIRDLQGSIPRKSPAGTARSGEQG